MRGARLLTLLGGKRGWRDNFNALSGWTTRAGTPAVAGGALQASALGDWGLNLLTSLNCEFTTDAAGWVVENDAVLSQRDATALGIAPTGGDDVGILEVRNAGTANAVAKLAVPAVVGYTYHAQCRAYAPSANTQTNAAQLLFGSPTATITAEDSWQTLSTTWATTVTTINTRLYCLGSTDGDVTYYDAVQMYLTSAAITRAFRANATLTAGVQMPASGVVPRSIICRYTDELNYWEIRLHPNTAGNDCHIIEVVNGVETTRASADVDWTVNAVDEVKVTLSGSTITVYHRKSGAATWTQACTYASATTGQTSAEHGLLVWGATDPAFTYLEVA